MVQGYHIHRRLTKPLRLPSQAVWGNWFNFRPASSTSFSSLEASQRFELHQSITLKNGHKGTIVERGKNGWLSIALEEDKRVVKVRSTEVVTSNEPLVLLEEVESKEAEFVPLERLPVIEPPLAHQQCKHWVIFSDLHVKGSSIETCEQVLQKVHDEAKARNGGVIFLGDFWHVRGALSVELLNRVLKAFRTWTQPVIMIPGNHDQVSLGGTIHALEPLKYAFRPDQIVMIDEPSICMNALWIPYRRDRNVMKQILDFSWKSSDISIIFCHADVCGAWMNDNIQSRDGLDMMMFPPSIPIYSGHFHKPHTLIKQSHSLKYVGSPYQTSLSEADQVKYLYSMEVQDGVGKKKWKEVERWPIQVGKKYMKIQDLSDSRLQQVNAGDRVVMTIPIQHFSTADTMAMKLREKGVEVEIRPERIVFQKNHSSTSMETSEKEDIQSNSFPQIETVVELDPINLFKQYMDEVNLATLEKPSSDQGQTSLTALKDQIMQEGMKVLDKLLGNANNDNHRIHAAAQSNVNNQHVREVRDMKLDMISLKDFGPYGGKKVAYPLSKRGLVLIRGKSTDGTGADSNGSGKTTLAMSILWALTGSMDTRIVSDTRSFDVAFDAPMSSSIASNKRFAEVKLIGQINQQSFEIIRRKSPKKQELFFSLDGKDMTTQSVKDTQTMIDTVLGIGNGLLQRCYFFGQHSHTSQSLLGLTDTKLKEEFYPLINSDIWIAACQEIRQQMQHLKNELQELQLMLKLKANDEVKFTSQVKDAQSEVEGIFQQILRLEASKPNISQIVEKYQSLELQLQDIDQRRQRIYTEDVMKLREQVSSLLKSAPVNSLSTSFSSPYNTTSSSNNNRTRTTTTNLDRTSRSNFQYNKTDLEPLRQSFSQLSASVQSTKYLLEDLEKKITQEQKQIQVLQSKLLTSIQSWKDNELFYSNNYPDSFFDLSTIEADLSSKDNLDQKVPMYQMQSDQYMLELRLLDEKIVHTNDTLTSLQSASALSSSQSLHTSSSSSNGCNKHLHPISKSTPLSVKGVGMEEETSTTSTHEAHLLCPTCGQHFPDNTTLLAEKIEEHQILLTSYLQERFTLLYHVQAYQRLKVLLDQLSGLYQELDLLERSMQSKVQEQQSHQKNLQFYQSEIAKVQQKIDAIEEELLQENKHWQDSLASTQSALQEAEEQYQQLQIQYDQLKQQMSQMKQSLDAQRRQEMNFNQQLIQLQATSSFKQQSLSQKEQELQQLKEQLVEMDSKKKQISHQNIIFDKLQMLLGTKGIQHYLFQSAITQLEVLANNYLMILSDGGIRLQLKSDVEQEKVLKSVMMRSLSDGEWRERGLAQLSGGQWRRVSLALDLAFIELVRRRGILRCNTMIMDEILTHLDAQGRESVGTVLKALVEHDMKTSEHFPALSVEEKMEIREEEEERRVLSNALTDATYETILVILQDLVATELEESFDHIGVVVKDGDASRVILDGGIDA